MKIFIFCLFIGCTISVSAQFSQPFFITYNTQPGSFDLADFDGDGDQDIIMGTRADYDRSLVWYENTDDIGGTWAAHEIEHGASISQIRTLDVDADGDMDFVSGSLTGGSLHLFRNNGNASNLSFTKELIDDYFSDSFFELVDMNNDNVLEIITGHGIHVKQYNNVNGLGDFEETILVEDFDLDFNIRLIQDAQVIDLDADGDKDIVMSRAKNGVDDETQIGWYRNDQNGFSDFIILENNITNLFGCNPICDINTQLVVANFTNDNLPDIIYLDDGNPHIISQQPNHSFYPPNQIADLSYPGDLHAIDMDDDGDMDFVSGSQNWTHFTRTWYRNIDGFGTFEEVVLDTLDETYGYNFIRTADVENDGDQDLFFFSTDGNTRGINGIYLNRNEGGGNFANHTFVTDNINGPFTSIPNDLDADGDIDVLIFAKDEANIYWSENINIGDTLSVPKLLIENGNIKYFQTADLDNDNDLDIIVISEQGELAWYQLLDTTPNYSDKIILDNNIVGNIKIGDLDGDGWNDIITDVFAPLPIGFYKNLGNGNFANPESIPIPDLEDLITLDDVNVDGLLDIIYTNENGDLLIAFQNAAGLFSSVQLSNLESGERFLNARLVDIDNDGDLDIFGTTFHVNGAKYTFLEFINEGNTFVEHTIFDHPIPYDLRNYQIEDLDGDGKKDLCVPGGFFRQLYSPTLFSSLVSNKNFLTSIEHDLTHADLDNDGDLDQIHGHWQDGLVWKKNQINEGYWIEGQVFLDDNQNCEYNVGTDSLLSSWLVELEKDNEKFYVSINSQGYYNAFVPDTGEYIINIVTPSVYWGSCIQDSIVQVVDSIGSVLLDIPVLILKECPLLNINIGSTPQRPCIDGSISVSYENYGTIPAEDAQLEIVPDNFYIINGSNIPWNATTDSSYIFDLGTIDVFESGNIYFNVTPDCDSVMVGDLLCTNAYITPDSICADSLWDGSTIEAFGTCNGDSINFLLENIGNDPMSEARQFKIQIVNDDIVVLILVDTFLLGVGETKNITINTQQADALFLEAEQDPNHPVANNASLLVDNCLLPNTNFNNLVLNFPNEDGNPFSETHCQVVTGSYDPNEKVATPKGVGNENLIERDWEIEYTIHFQNTGNDTAFTVVLKDPISDDLDLSTLRVNGASHDFTWELDLNRELVFTFENILLADSTTNEPASHGYVHFSIKPNADIPFGREIKNYAAIYFDFNDPIITNTTMHKIRTPVYGYSDHFELCEGNMDYGFSLEMDTILIDTFSFTQGYHVQFTHLDVLYNSVTEIDTMFYSGEIFMGIPILQDTTFEEVLTDINGCDSLVLTNVALLTDVDKISDFEKIKVYPNPLQNQFFIDWKNANEHPIRLEIYNANGSIVHTLNQSNFNDLISFGKTRVDVKNWQTGIYTLKFETDSKIYHRKLVIIK